jgi:hypothetical protein
MVKRRLSMRPDRQRLAAIETEARAMARSGKYGDFLLIRALMRDRYPEAQKLFMNRWLQEELNRICEQARWRQSRPDLGQHVPMPGHYAPA